MEVISRDATKRAIERLITYYDFGDVDAYDKAKERGDKYALGVVDAMDVVDDMLPVEPKDGEWIPCEKEMPNEYGLYLVTTKNGRVKLDRFYPDSNIWGINTRYGYGKAEYRAWMRMPKPYEGREQ